MARFRMRHLPTVRAGTACLPLAAFPALAQKIDSGPDPGAFLRRHVKVLADSKLAGRAPGGPGDAGTLAYIISQFKAAGLQPAGDKGGWTRPCAADPLQRRSRQGQVPA